MNLHLRLAEAWPGAFAGLDIRFIAYGEGRDTGGLIANGTLDIGGTGSTPPIMAQAGGLDVLYVAASAPRPANGALLVRSESDIESVADIAGKRVALIDGSFHTYLLARSLEQVGLGLKDVIRCEMSPARSRAALAKGEVDVWIAMAPQIDQAITAGEARLLSLSGSAIPNRSVFWTLKPAGLPARVLDLFVAGLVRIGNEITNDPERAARLLADMDRSGTDADAWKKVVVGRNWQIVPANPALVAEQQEEADTLHRHGDLGRQLRIEAFFGADETVL